MDETAHVKPPRSTPNGRGPRKPAKRNLPIGLVIAIDVLLAALLLGIFYVTNYMVKAKVEPTALPTPSHVAAASSSAVEATVSASATGETTEATVDPSDWRAKFADKFTDGEPIQTDNSYISNDINISINMQTIDGVRYYVADIYVADLECFKTAFAKDADVMGDREMTDVVAGENNATLAINGDHCVDNTGPVVRNGQIYREEAASADVLVMNYDGSMETFAPENFDLGQIKSEGAYQVWTFGPMLLNGGQPMTEFNSTVTGLNPRTAVGYFEPGHYCFVVVGGRQEGYNEGCTMTQLSQFMYDLGCTVAYNLDGGRSSEMIFMGQMLNEQSSGRRSTTDILYVGENEG